MKKTINCKGTLLDLSEPKIMGIINITPDSFYAGSRSSKIVDILKIAEKMLNDGANILDIGGYSSRPGADHVSVSEELKRVVEPISSIKEKFPDCVISIDTFRSEIAKEAIGAGASMVNDISGGKLDNKMFELIGDLQVPYILMHMRGTPQTMNSFTDYENLLNDIILELQTSITNLKNIGVKDIIVDPGFGFAKSISQNFEILKNLDLLDILDSPLLIGLSRKSMIYKTLGILPEESLTATAALNFYALNKKARILRVHDIKEAKQLITLKRELD